jgi:hypothetical protein
MSEAKCETGWGDGPSTEALADLRDHPTPLRIPLRFMRNDPPPPGEGKKTTTSRSRGAVTPEFCIHRVPPRAEGAGKTGRWSHPRPGVQR